MNYSITNNTKRIVGLQRVALLLGVFGGPVQPGESIVVPPEYIDAMKSEKSFAASEKAKELTVSKTDAEAVPVSRAPADTKGKTVEGFVLGEFEKRMLAEFDMFKEHVVAKLAEAEAKSAKALADMADRLEKSEAKCAGLSGECARVANRLTAAEGKVEDFETKIDALGKKSK